MDSIGQRLLQGVKFIVFGLLGMISIAALVAVRHMLETPQQLESTLSGEARIYRWKDGHIYYKVLGPTDAPSLVLLHAPGIGASAYEMRKVAGTLAQQYRVYVPDLLGFGLSDRPQIEYVAETYVALCQDFLRDVVRQSATILASGLSCNYAVVTASRFPELCQRLVLISPVELFGGQQPPKVLEKIAQLPATGALLYPLASTRIALRYGMARQYQAKDAFPASNIDYLYASTHQFGAQYAPMALLAGKLSLDASEAFEHLQQPTLIVWGARALNNTRALASQHHVSPKTQMVLIQAAGQHVHEEHPAMVIANIREWSDEKQPEPITSPAKSAVTSASNHESRSETTSMQDVLADHSPAENASDDTDTQSIEAYCVKCKRKTQMQHIQEVVMKNGRAALQGTCPVCGTKLYRIGGRA
jgi:pimeloyl-ACP methyl ester carboxylesterase/Zn finger protein HypA/HybF involved in hydrogenase expression